MRTGGEKERLMRRTTRTRIGCLAVAIALPASFAACSSNNDKAADQASTTTVAPTPTNNGQTVSITGSGTRFAYEPATVTVKAGTVITFKNDSATKHTVKTDSGQTVDFSSDNLASGETFVKTIDTPGTYTYFCAIHLKAVMSGTIVVTP
jgi:plastocyanin